MMGYTHYWYRPKEIPKYKFHAIVVDFRKLLPLFRRLGINLAGGLGTGRPKINDKEVIFNGSKYCGHPKNEISVPWPAPQVKFGVAPKPLNAVVGTWFAGLVLDQRTCNGDCSYETFYFPRVMPDRYKPVESILYYDINGRPVYNDGRVVGKYFSFCKTAFRPYDLAVNCFLIIARHHLGEDLIVRSDGTATHWVDAVTICFNAFKYNDFVLNDKKVEPFSVANNHTLTFLQGGILRIAERNRQIKKALSEEFGRNYVRVNGNGGYLQSSANNNHDSYTTRMQRLAILQYVTNLEIRPSEELRSLRKLPIQELDTLHDE